MQATRLDIGAPHGVVLSALASAELDQPGDSEP